jgi:TLR4 regulator and MIR-interacting MSAP
LLEQSRKTCNLLGILCEKFEPNMKNCMKFNTLNEMFDFCCLAVQQLYVCLNFRELRLTEALLEPHICENILNYNVHAERKGSLRYAKGMSETMQTLHGLVYVHQLLDSCH